MKVTPAAPISVNANDSINHQASPLPQHSMLSWNERQRSLHEANRFMFDNKPLCDVTFILPNSLSSSFADLERHPQYSCNESSRIIDNNLDTGGFEKVEAHRFVLVARSPVFYAMFCGPLVNDKETINNTQIVIADLTADVFNEILRYLYYEEAEITGENVFSILYGAKKYLIEPLADLCRAFLKQALNIEDVYTILQQAITFSESDLVKHCHRFVRSHTSEVLKSPGFLELSLDALELIVHSEELNIEEVELFRACVRWGREKLRRRRDQILEKGGPSAVSDSEIYRHSNSLEGDIKCTAETSNNVEISDCEKTVATTEVRLTPVFLTDCNIRSFKKNWVKISAEKENISRSRPSGSVYQKNSENVILLSRTLQNQAPLDVRVSAPQLDKIDEENLSAERLRHVLGTLLPYIQYDTMTLNDIEHQVLPSGLLSKKQIEEILRRIMAVRREPGPFVSQKRNKLWLEPAVEGSKKTEGAGKIVEEGGKVKSRKGEEINQEERKNKERKNKERKKEERKNKKRGRSKSVDRNKAPVIKSGMSWSVPFQIFW